MCSDLMLCSNYPSSWSVRCWFGALHVNLISIPGRVSLVHTVNRGGGNKIKG